MSFPAYPGYKHSGVELLGELPEHWTLKRFKNVFEERAERSADGLEELLSVSAYFGIKPRSESRDEGDHLSRAESLEGYKVCHPGDLVINIMLAWSRGLGFSWQSGIVSPAYCVFHVTDGSSPKFLDYLVRSDECIRYFKTHSAGIMDSRLRLYPESFGRLFTAIPPTCEQTQIARFLDHETARIDALIEEQHRLIELLKEKRQTVISHAVTKGLDSTVPMKDSGVDWLGEVPAHWVVGPLRWYATIQGGIAKGKDYEGRETVSLPYLRVANVQNGFVDLTEVKEISVLESEVERYSLRSGDVLMNEGGDNDKLGRGTVWQGQIEPCLHQNHVFAIRPNDLLSAEWLTAFTQCDQARSYFFLNSKQSTNLASISASNVMSLALPIPSVAEQKEILSVLNEGRVAHEELVNLATSTVEFLQERRSALISAAVTGKIDVRGWQPPARAQAPVLEAEAV
ncbi:restriction endonuclease subunit S [Pseudomonas lundensis]|uniref:Restriction modification system DNA specificity domain protein n=1 Tax=Pseudomonas lundensis TaxID=86185 RepID=A0AAX2H319_9PSED|nr:restriction endonuclease subunit S [Pseudomonas lundensis]SOB49369.1 Restriction modification system DNA specificity domain protein [Pseudomonas lundensis]